jgi:hypothetical protein
MVMAIKVSQATIDKIKKMGMTKALAGAKSANPEMKEALTRMYGARRVSAATKSTTAKPVAKSADAARSAAMSKPKFKSVDSARRSTMSGNRPAAAKKKSTTTDPFAKAVFGGLGALGRTLSVEPRVTAAQVKARAEAKKRAAANKNK